MFLVRFKTLQLCQILEELTEDFIISRLLPFLMTGKICLKSPPKITTFPPKGLFKISSSTTLIISHIVRSNASKQNFCIIGASSHIIRLASLSNLALGYCCFTLQVDCSLIFNGIQKVECAVLPPGNNRDAIPLDAT